MRVAKLVLSLAVVLFSLPAAAENLLNTDQFRGSVPGIVIRDVASGGRPWVLDSIKAQLKAPDDGEASSRLKVDVKGLVFAPGTIIGGVDVGGTTGAVTHFAATLSCVNELGQTVNVTTGGFPTTTTGNARIEQDIDVPAVCYAPIVLVRSFTPAAGNNGAVPAAGTAGNWFASTGF